jgi:hypothetical protein
MSPGESAEKCQDDAGAKMLHAETRENPSRESWIGSGNPRENHEEEWQARN